MLTEILLQIYFRHEFTVLQAELVFLHNAVNLFTLEVRVGNNNVGEHNAWVEYVINSVHFKGTEPDVNNSNFLINNFSNMLEDI